MEQKLASQDRPNPQATGLHARALLVGDRLAPDRSSHRDLISSAPLCFREGRGFVVIYRYGAVVLVALSPEEEEAILARYDAPIEEERIELVIRPDLDEGIADNGRLQMKALTAAHVLALADILAKSIALARYEREIASVFDKIEPAASTLAVSGRIPSARKALLRLIGTALLAQHRVSGRIAFAEKPDILWDHPELERFYARLEDEYEIIERGTLLNGKVGVIASAAQTFADMMDAARSVRLEVMVVLLIVAELVLGAVQMLR